MFQLSISNAETIDSTFCNDLVSSKCHLERRSRCIVDSSTAPCHCLNKWRLRVLVNVRKPDSVWQVWMFDGKLAETVAVSIVFSNLPRQQHDTEPTTSWRQSHERRPAQHWTKAAMSHDGDISTSKTTHRELLLILPLHQFNGLFSRITWVSRHQKGKPFWNLLEQEKMGWQRHQLDHTQIICSSLQIDNHTSTSPLSFYRPDALPAAQPTALKHIAK